MAQKYAIQMILLTYVFLCVCFLCAGTSSLVQDTQSQTQLVWTSSPSFQRTLRTQNQMQMRVRCTVFDTHTHTHNMVGTLVKKTCKCVERVL